MRGCFWHTTETCGLSASYSCVYWILPMAPCLAQCLPPTWSFDNSSPHGFIRELRLCCNYRPHHSQGRLPVRQEKLRPHHSWVVRATSNHGFTWAHAVVEIAKVRYFNCSRLRMWSLPTWLPPTSTELCVSGDTLSIWGTLGKERLSWTLLCLGSMDLFIWFTLTAMLATLGKNDFWEYSGCPQIILIRHHGSYCNIHVSHCAWHSEYVGSEKKKESKCAETEASVRKVFFHHQMRKIISGIFGSHWCLVKAETTFRKIMIHMQL